MRDNSFPYHLGYCQEDSTLRFHHPFRNIVWLASRPEKVFVLDAGVSSPLAELLLPWTASVGTVYEGDLGASIADVIFAPELATLPLVVPTRSAPA